MILTHLNLERPHNSILNNLNNNHTAILFETFKKSNHEIRFVGGCVRDALIGAPISDIDFATTSSPQITKETLTQANIHHFDSGIKHGTITAVFDKIGYEITTLRFDKNCDGRHAEVEFTSDWKLDASRRDFTFNALYISQSGEVFDYFDGINDLKNGVLRFIGSARHRIQEDYLRILRAFRFADRFTNAQIDAETLKVINELGPKIQLLSGERIAAEMTKLLETLTTTKIFDALCSGGLNKFVFGQDQISLDLLNFALESPDFKNIHSLNIAWLRLGLILRDNQMDVTFIKNRWKASNVALHILLTIINMKIDQDFEAKPYKYQFLYRDFEEIVLVIAAREGYKTVSFQNAIKSNAYPELPIKNLDLMDAGFSGSNIGIKYKKALNFWLESNCQASREEILDSI